MFVVSFYSFKGGVGRTVALLNSAWALAARGHRVALLDLDLEAPGLHTARLRHSMRSGEENWKRSEPRLGFCDLVRAYQEDGLDAARNALADCLGKKLGPGGNLALIPAHGPRALEYNVWVQDFSWASGFFSSSKPGTAFLDEVLIDGTSQAGFEYLFIDGRTGLTDVRLVTLAHLPDLVVFVTNLTDQSIEGTEQQLRLLTRINAETSRKEGSQVRKLGAEHQSIWSILVASPLPQGEFVATHRRLEQAETALGRPIDVQIEHLPFMALNEENQILAQHVSRPTRSGQWSSPYDRLASAIVARNPEAPENLLAQGRRLNDIGRWRDALAHFDDVEDRPNVSSLLRSEAQLQKVRSRLLGLKADSAQKILDGLASDSATDGTSDELMQARLATAWTYQILNEFSKGQEVSAVAVREASKLPAASVEGALWQAHAHYFHGQLSWLCDDYPEAERALEAAVSECQALGTAPLLHCLALSELGRVRTWRNDVAGAQNALKDANLLVDRAGGARPAVESTYIRARVQQASAEADVAMGRGAAALTRLKKARTTFVDEGDEVASLEVDAAIFQLDLKRTNWESSWQSIVQAAKVLRTPLLEIQLRLVRLARVVCRWDRLPDANQLKPELQQCHRKASGIASARRELESRVLLEECRLLLVENVLHDARAALDSAQERLDEGDRCDAEASGVYHELAMLRVLTEHAAEDQQAVRVATTGLLGSLHQDRARGAALRAARAWAVLAIVGRAGKEEVPELEAPTGWLWNLPIAFVEHAPSLQASFARALEKTPLRTMWPRHSRRS